MLPYLAEMVINNHPSIKRHLKHALFLDSAPPEAQAHFIVELARRRLEKSACLPQAFPSWHKVSKVRRDADFIDAWAEIPLTTKNDLRNRFSPQELALPASRKHHKLATGGSTGEPTEFIHDDEMRASKAAAAVYFRRLCGHRPGDSVICLWGSERDIGKAQSPIRGFLMRMRGQVLVPGYKLNDDTVDRVVREVKAHRSVAFYGFTSMLEHVARRVLERGINIPPGVVSAAWSGGETVSMDQQSIFQRAFGIPFRNFYGGREVGSIACQCDDIGALKVLRSHLLVEIVDDAGRPVTDSKPGRVVVTALNCNATPFIRYEIGDIASTDVAFPKCLGSQSITSLHGRSNGLIKLANGNTLCGLYWNHLFKQIPSVRQFQIAVHSSGAIEMRLKGEQLAAEEEERLLATVSKSLGQQNITIVWQDELTRTREGKLIQVVKIAA
jgi:phenylacetate-CoA ligase